MDKLRNIPILLRDNRLLVLFLVVASVSISFLVACVNIIISPLIIATIIGIVVMFLIFLDYRWGFYSGIVLTSIMFYFERLIPVSIPYGILCDLLFLGAFVSLLFNTKEKRWRSGLYHPIAIGYFLLFVYQLFQVFNPNAVSLAGWIISLRALLFPLILVTSLALVAHVSGVKMILKLWLSIATFAAMYAIYQEVFGLTGFEMRWVTADPLRYGLYFVLGNMRKFSFLADPSSFGVFMAYSGLAAFSLLFAPIAKTKKIVLAIAFVLMTLSMLYSGTRTAYAILFIGVLFFILITIRKKVTFIVAIVLGFCCVLVLFGPFYNRYVNRLRTVFRPSQDASMQVRDVNRAKWQPYVLEHPMGGGLNTTGSPGVKYSKGHELAGGDWDPDSGYFKVALEQGWIGLTIVMIFFLMVMVKGINNYFNLRDPLLQSLNLAFLIPFFAASIANYTQNAIWYKPLFLFVIVTYSVFISIEKFDLKNLKS